MEKFSEFFYESEFRFEGESVGIVTAHTKIDSSHEDQTNKNRSEKFFGELRALGYDPWPFFGKYEGRKEKSFLIPNISKLDLIKLGNRYNQKVVIWAKKVPNDGYSVEWLKNGNLIKKEKINSIKSLISRAKG